MESWERVKAAGRMQDYIEQHLLEPVTLRELARAAGYSPWHCERVFREVTGLTPFDYIRKMRLSGAAKALSKGAPRVIDVALDFVFDSHEGFTRAFSREFGVSPKRYSKTGAANPPFLPAAIRDYYLKKQKGEPIMAQKQHPNTVFVQVSDRPARKLILKRGFKATHYFEYCEEVGCDVWDVLSDIKDALYEPIGMWLPQNLVTPGTSTYAQGVEMPADFSGPVPEGYELTDLPPCKMMIFQGPPFEDEKFEDAIEEVWDAIASYDPEPYGFRWADEDGPRFQLAPFGYRGYMEGRPVRPIGEK